MVMVHKRIRILVIINRASFLFRSGRDETLREVRLIGFL
jgi:hypothetical protein